MKLELMKNKLFNVGNGAIAFLIMLACLMPLRLLAEEATLTFGVVPQFEPRKLASIWTPIIEAVEKSSGVKLRMVGAAQIPDFEHSFQAGEYDFAYMNPYHAIVANRVQGYQPLLRDVSRKLKGILVIRKDSPYLKAGDLNGKVIAFPAPNALGASLLMRAELTNLKHIDYSPSYTKTHSSVYLSVLLGQAEAGGGVMSTFKRQDKKIQDKLRIIHTTREMEPHPVVVHPRVSAGTVEKVRQAFMSLMGSDSGRELLSKVPIKVLGSASFDDYKPISQWGLEAFYVE
jgi:phosphonate transport system substrate-binding protein